MANKRRSRRGLNGGLNGPTAHFKADLGKKYPRGQLGGTAARDIAAMGPSSLSANYGQAYERLRGGGKPPPPPSPTLSRDMARFSATSGMPPHNVFGYHGLQDLAGANPPRREVRKPQAGADLQQSGSPAPGGYIDTGAPPPSPTLSRDMARFSATSGMPPYNVFGYHGLQNLAGANPPRREVRKPQAGRGESDADGATPPLPSPMAYSSQVPAVLGEDPGAPTDLQQSESPAPGGYGALPYRLLEWLDNFLNPRDTGTADPPVAQQPVAQQPALSPMAYSSQVPAVLGEDPGVPTDLQQSESPAPLVERDEGEMPVAQQPVAAAPPLTDDQARAELVNYLAGAGYQVSSETSDSDLRLLMEGERSKRLWGTSTPALSPLERQNLRTENEIRLMNQRSAHLGTLGPDGVGTLLPSQGGQSLRIGLPREVVTHRPVPGSPGSAWTRTAYPTAQAGTPPRTPPSVSAPFARRTMPASPAAHALYGFGRLKVDAFGSGGAGRRKRVQDWHDWAKREIGEGTIGKDGKPQPWPEAEKMEIVKKAMAAARYISSGQEARDKQAAADAAAQRQLGASGKRGADERAREQKQSNWKQTQTRQTEKDARAEEERKQAYRMKQDEMLLKDLANREKAAQERLGRVKDRLSLAEEKDKQGHEDEIKAIGKELKGIRDSRSKILSRHSWSPPPEPVAVNGSPPLEQVAGQAGTPHAGPPPERPEVVTEPPAGSWQQTSRGRKWIPRPPESSPLTYPKRQMGLPERLYRLAEIRYPDVVKRAWGPPGTPETIRARQSLMGILTQLGEEHANTPDEQWGKMLGNAAPSPGPPSGALPRKVPHRI